MVEQSPLKRTVLGSIPSRRTNRQQEGLCESERCFCLSFAQGKNREAGSREFCVSKITCDHKNCNKYAGVAELVYALVLGTSSLVD